MSFVKRLGIPVFIVLSGVCLAFFQNCSSPVTFEKIEQLQFSSETVPLGDPVDPSGPSLYQTKQIFSTTTTGTNPKIDVLWVVDNSGSMAQEADHVQANLDAFVNHLALSTNVKLVLVSRTRQQSRYGVTLSNEAKAAGMVQIERNVTSTSALSDILAEQNVLRTHFRSDAAKAFVIVTDDNSALSATNFMDRLDSSFLTDLRVYGFTAFDRTRSPCLAKEGVIYQELASLTGGAVYNICDADWSQHFGDLVNRVGAQVGNNHFRIQHLAVRIDSVKVNGATLTPAQYQVNEKTISIDLELLRTIGTHSIEVVYTHN
jgi:hypothetical protein